MKRAPLLHEKKRPPKYTLEPAIKRAKTPQKKKRIPAGKALDGSGGRAFAAAFVVTLMLAAGLGSSMAALERMENTMSAETFTLLSLEAERSPVAQANAPLEGRDGMKPDEKDKLYQLTVLGREYEVRLTESGMEDFALEKLVGWLPSECGVFLLAADKLTEAMEGWIEQLL